MTNSEEIKLALLVQRVEQLSDEILSMKRDLDGLKSNALRISGGLAVIVIISGIIGWVVSMLTQLKLK